MQNTTQTAQIEDSLQENLKVLNFLLTDTIHLASADFLHVCNVFAGLNLAENGNVSQAVKELQQVDAMRQKLQHILDLHNAALSGERAANEDGEEIDLQEIISLVLKLNHYQLVAAHEDFSNAVTKVRGIMDELKLSKHNSTSFVNLQRINSNFGNISTTLSYLANEYSTVSDFNLSHVADYFSDRYSMLSERIVLNWCISSEYDSMEDFKKYYSSLDKAESIELF